VHFFALAAPDLLLGAEVEPAQRNIVALLRSHPEVAREALELRSLGQRVTEVIGGRGTHPVAAVAGGLSAPLTKARGQALAALAQQAVPLASRLFETARQALVAREELLFSLPLESHYLGTVKDGALDLYDGVLRLRSPDGAAFDFPEDDWAKHLEEEVCDGSYAKPVFFRTADGQRTPFRVGALARLNCAERIDTPRANAELQRFRELGGFPCHQTVMYHYARLIELLHATEKLAEVVADPELLSDQIRTVPRQPPRAACAHVEAPRGVLIHDYEVDPGGIVTRANLIVATQQNITSINRTIRLSAERFLDQTDEALMNGIEFGIRCYDPCLSCATHRLGDMKLDVVVRQDGVVIRHARRS
jgi:F420-non-reducing hydrogenase large subunit